jgi:hypothetical protein
VGNYFLKLKRNERLVGRSLRRSKWYEGVSFPKNQTDTYHNFPNSFDQHIINTGTWSQRIKDAANWYELSGTINGVEGMYQIGVSPSDVIFHRNFVPFY